MDNPRGRGRRGSRGVDLAVVGSEREVGEEGGAVVLFCCLVCVVVVVVVGGENVGEWFFFSFFSNRLTRTNFLLFRFSNQHP